MGGTHPAAHADMMMRALVASNSHSTAGMVYIYRERPPCRHIYTENHETGEGGEGSRQGGQPSPHQSRQQVSDAVHRARTPLRTQTHTQSTQPWHKHTDETWHAGKASIAGGSRRSRPRAQVMATWRRCQALFQRWLPAAVCEQQQHCSSCGPGRGGGGRGGRGQPWEAGPR